MATGVTTAAVCGLVGAAPALASFSRATSPAAATYTSGTLLPPVSASATCASAGSTATATINWGGSTSSKVTGYSITSTPASSTKTVASAARTTTLTGLPKSVTYTFNVVTTYGTNWTSAPKVTASVAC